MSDHQTPSKCDLVHVATGPLQTVGRVDSLLRKWGIRACTFSDAYRALVRLGRSEPTSFNAVIVCVDFISPGEFEFFEIVGRDHPDVDLYVYGDDRCDHKITRAIELGARGRLTDDAVRAMAQDMPAVDEAEPSAAPQMPSQGDTREPAARRSAKAGEKTVSSEHNRGHQDETVTGKKVKREPTGVRVPWLGYADGPRRIPPRRADKRANESSSIQPSSVTDDQEPLLTDAELEALIGRDEDPSPSSSDSDRSEPS